MTDLIVKSWKKSRHGEESSSSHNGFKLGKNKAKKPLEVARIRLIVAGFIFTACFLVLSTRLVDLSLIGTGTDSASSQNFSTSELTLNRRDIVDRNNIVLATNLPTESLFVDPREVLEPEKSIQEIKTVLPEINTGSLLRLINSGGSFHWVSRNLTPEQVWQINNLGLPGFKFVEEERRVYPHGALFAHALGFAGIDNRGLAGIEAALDSRLTGKANVNAEPLKTSLDVRVQHALTIELSEAMAAFKAKGAAGLVIDVHTGELVAMTSLPAFDLNLYKESSPNERFNRATLGVYELGSVFKAFNTALALDSGLVDITDSYDATKPLKVSRFLIRDDHPKNSWLTVPEIFIHSSNIGSARMAMTIGAEKQQKFLSQLGMLKPIKIEIPESGHPLSPSTWRDINTMTVSYGHGIAVTPLHAISGFATLVNGGIKRQPTLLFRDQNHKNIEGTRIIGADTSLLMRKLMYQAVTEGTGKSAQVEGYLVGGKTGTAEKVVAGSYQRKAIISTFIAAFPIERPRYAVLVSLDEPQGNKLTHNLASAGWTAAPATGRIISKIGPLLGVPPTITPSIFPDKQVITRPVKNILRTEFRRIESATF